MMRRIEQGRDKDFRPCVATIGFFDGVHQGHRFLLEQVNTFARKTGRYSLAITFPIAPRQVLQPDFRPQLLSTLDEKLRLLADTGIDGVCLLPFTKSLSQLTAREFMQLLLTDYGVNALIVGYDHRFGKGKEEGFDDYVRYGHEMGIEVMKAEAFLPDNRTVSSSEIRRLLGLCRVDEAAQLLGYNYRYAGKVEYGHQVGRTIGFPTANLSGTDSFKLLPADGIYAVFVWIGGKRFQGMLDIGFRPTLQNGSDRTIEVHILDFDRDIYGEVIELEFVKYLRADIKFDTIEELTAQLYEDKKATLACLQKIS